MHDSINVKGTELQKCSSDPLTGWFRDGCCNTDGRDRGSHTVCAIVTDDFLQFALSQGNDLITPAPQFGFPGLKAGDRWCVCAGTWQDAAEAGVACPVVLEAHTKKHLQYVTLRCWKAMRLNHPLTKNCPIFVLPSLGDEESYRYLS